MKTIKDLHFVKLEATSINSAKFKTLFKKFGAEGWGCKCLIECICLADDEIPFDADKIEELYEIDAQVVDNLINESGYFYNKDGFLRSVAVDVTKHKQITRGEI